MSGLGRLGLVPREVGSIGSIPAKTGLHQDKMRNKSRMNENSAQGQVFITSAPPHLAPPAVHDDSTRVSSTGSSSRVAIARRLPRHIVLIIAQRAGLSPM